jgi:hypothetical protein
VELDFLCVICYNKRLDLSSLCYTSNSIMSKTPFVEVLVQKIFSKYNCKSEIIAITLHINQTYCTVQLHHTQIARTVVHNRISP